jgi:hypothetical protein
MEEHVVAGLWDGGHGHDGAAAGSAGAQQSGAALPVSVPIHGCYRSASCTTSCWSMAGSVMSTQPPPVTAALPPGSVPGWRTAELRAGAIAAPPHPGPLPNQTGVLGISSASGDDRPIALLLLPVGAGAGLAGASGRHHRGGGSVTPEGHVTLGNTWGRAAPGWGAGTAHQPTLGCFDLPARRR